MEFFTEYGLFLAKTITLVAAVLAVIIVLFSLGQRNRRMDKGHIEVKDLNSDFDSITRTLRQAILDEDAFKREAKLQKKQEKQAHKSRKKTSADDERKPRVYVIDFDGDIQASAVTNLRHEVTAILSVAEPRDEVVVRLESPGGHVHGYGLAASQLTRIVGKEIPLTIAVDKVAASGGYMMACIGTRIIAAPFALLGSIGVVAQIPNFHRFLKNRDVDVEVLTAGEYKRTLTIFGENTEKGREKFQQELEDVHALFKEFVGEHRPAVNLEAVATGEAWYGRRALEQQLVDEIKTSDEYIVEKCDTCDVFQVRYVEDKNRLDRVMDKMTRILGRITGRDDFFARSPYGF